MAAVSIESVKPSSPERSSPWTVAAMIGMVTLPAVITLHTVRTSALNSPAASDPGSAPHGYTVSLLLFILPILITGLWFLPQAHVPVSQKSFWTTIGVLFPLGAALDFLFARYFFVFPNAGATLGIKAPALGNPVPVEEYVFYFTGFVCILLLYIWLDESWLHAYTVIAKSALRTEQERLLHPHYESIALALILGAGAILLKRHTSYPDGLPGYFLFILLIALTPSSVLFRAVRPVVNWRAFSFTAFLLLLISLLWEVTLAIPYGWWNFQAPEMLGIRITAWGNLPIEEVVLWLAVTYSTIIVYEAIKCWQGSGRPARHAFLGHSC